MTSEPPTGDWKQDPTGRYAYRWWDGTEWTDHVWSSGVGTRDSMAPGQDPRSESAAYTGPRPSPARPWAPWVIVTSAASAIGNAAVCVLNLIERHSQQQRLTGTPPSVAHIQHTLNTIHAFTSFDLIASTAFVVAGVVWSLRRRPKTRLKRDGETAVEPALRKVLPVVYWAFWAMLVGSLLLTASAASVVHTGMTIPEVVSYRARLAGSAATRTVMWACWIPLVIRSTQLQKQREATSPVAPIR